MNGGDSTPTLTPEMEKIVAAAVAAALASQKATESKAEQKADKEESKGNAAPERMETAPEVSSPPPPPSGVPGRWGIKTAFKSFLQRYAKFDGRASRPEFWYLALGNFIVVMSICLLDVVATLACLYSGTISLLSHWVCSILIMIYSLFLLIPGVALCVRRLHDTGRDWRLLPLVLIPVVGSFILLYFFIQPSAPANKYGTASDAPAGADEEMPLFVAAIVAQLRRPGRTAAILGGCIAVVAGVVVLINIVFARPNPLELLYEQGKLAKSPQDASDMYEALFCKQVEAYLEGDAELNALPYIANLLTVADSKGFQVPVEVVRALVALGADVNAKSKVGAFEETAWNLAVKMGDIAMLDYLASVGAKKTEWLDMEQPHVVQAVLEEKEELLRALARHGMSLDVQKSSTDYTALMAAADKGNTKMLNLLIELGANVNATRAELGGEKVTVLDMILRDGCDNDAEMVGSLIKAGAKATPNKLADKLFLCIDEGQTERLKMLLTAGAPLDAVQEFTAYTPLMAAVDKNNPEMVKMLLEAGADPKVTTKDEAGIEISALSVAKRKASPAVLALLGDEQSIKMQKALGDTKVISLDEAVEMLQKCEIIDEYKVGDFEQDILGNYEYVNKLGDISKEFMYNYMLYKEGHKTLADYGYVLSIYRCWLNAPDKHLPLEAVKAFIAAGSSLGWHYKNEYALDYAAFCGHTDIVKLMLSAGADAKLGSPLEDAAVKGHTEIVKLLLEVEGINVNLGNPLSKAAAKGHTEIVKLLLAADGIEVNSGSPLSKAAEKGHTEIAKLLLAVEGIDVNLGNPLLVASGEGYTEIVEMLLAAPGIDVNRKAEERYIPEGTMGYLYERGEFPLYRAALYNHVKIAELLLAAPGINVNNSFFDEYGTALLRAIRITARKSRQDMEIAKLLLAHPDINVNQASEYGSNTPLGVAREQENAEIIELLLAKQKSPGKSTGAANPSTSNSESSVSAEALEKLVPLYDRLARLKCREAYSALCQKRLLMLLGLIRNGADINVTTEETKGSNALHYACSLGSLSITKWLLENGADPNAKTAKGADPITCVGSDNREAIIRLLKQYGARQEQADNDATPSTSNSGGTASGTHGTPNAVTPDAPEEEPQPSTPSVVDVAPVDLKGKTVVLDYTMSQYMYEEDGENVSGWQRYDAALKNKNHCAEAFRALNLKPKATRNLLPITTPAQGGKYMYTRKNGCMGVIEVNTGMDASRVISIEFSSPTSGEAAEVVEAGCFRGMIRNIRVTIK